MDSTQNTFFTMNTQKMVILRIPYGRMLKSEVAELGNKTVAIAKSHDSELLLIDPLVSELEALMPEIDSMSFKYGVDPEILKVKTLKSKLMLTISALKLDVKLLEKSGIDDELHLIGSFIDGNLLKLHGSKNDRVLTQRVNGFLHAVESDEALGAAIVGKDLMDNIDAISMALKGYQAALTKRVRLLSERPKVDTKLIIDKIINALENFYKTVEVFHMTNAELDYTALIEELNQLLYMYRKSINMRIAYNKRKAEAKKNAESDVDGDSSDGSDAPIEGDAPETTNYSAYRPSRAFVLTNDDDDDAHENEQGFENDENDESEEDAIDVG